MFKRFTRFPDIAGPHDRYPLLEIATQLSGAYRAVERLWKPPVPESVLAAALAAIPNIYFPFQGQRQLSQSYRGSQHPAYDWPMDNLTDLFSSFEGEVVEAGYSSLGYAYHVCVRNDNLGPGLQTMYAHLDKNQGIAVKQGQTVKAGEFFGYSDNTGNSTGPHLHMDLRIKPYRYPWDCIDFYQYLVPLGSVITPEPYQPPASIDYPGSIELSGMQFKLKDGYEYLNIRSGPGTQYLDIGDLAPGQSISALRIYGPALWVEIETGKWCAMRNDGTVYLEKAV